MGMIKGAIAFGFLLPGISCCCALTTEPILYESAKADGHGGGKSVDRFQYLGERFHVAKATQVDHVGGDVGTMVPEPSSTIFVAITPLSGPSGFPLETPLTFTPAAATAITLFELDSNLLFPLNAFLPPGDYALVFGSNRFGATGRGYLGTNNTENPGASYFVGSMDSIFDNGIWRNDAGPRGMRFVVQGVQIPEPSAQALSAFTLLALPNSAAAKSPNRPAASRLC
jgi:hypothetical protein